MPSVDRVVVNQHRQHTACTAELLTLVHAAGSLTLSPGHVVWLDGGLAPARSATRRFGPLKRQHHHCDHRALGRHHQPNCCGRHHPRFGQGGRRPCARDDGRRVDGQRPPLGSPKVQPLVRARCTVPRDRPGVVQAYYDDALEPIFNAAVPTLSTFKFGRAGAARRPCAHRRRRGARRRPRRVRVRPQRRRHPHGGGAGLAAVRGAIREKRYNLPHPGVHHTKK